MLVTLSDLTGYVIAAADGDIGSVSRFFFDDERWTVRHIVADLGSWLTRRRVLLSPAAVEQIDGESRRILMRLSREQIRTSPDVDADKPVSRQQELALHTHYGYAPYWGGGGLWGTGYQPYALLAPPVLPAPPPTPLAPPADGTTRGDGDPHLRSTAEITGYRLCASDGEVGPVEDFVLDDESWAIRCLVVGATGGEGRRRVLVPPEWVREIDWARTQLRVPETGEVVRRRPEYRRGELAVHAAKRKEERVYHVNEIIGKSVLTTGNGEKLGTVSDALLDTASHRIVGLVIGNGMLAAEQVLPIADVETVGRDAILVRTSAHVMNPQDWRHADIPATRCSTIRGRRVVTTEGREVGHAADFLVEERTGELGGIEVEERSLAGLRHRRHVIAGVPPPQIGPDAIIVAGGTPEDASTRDDPRAPAEARRI